MNSDDVTTVETGRPTLVNRWKTKTVGAFRHEGAKEKKFLPILKTLSANRAAAQNSTWTFRCRWFEVKKWNNWVELRPNQSILGWHHEVPMSQPHLWKITYGLHKRNSKCVWCIDPCKMRFLQCWHPRFFHSICFSHVLYPCPYTGPLFSLDLSVNPSDLHLP